MPAPAKWKEIYILDAYEAASQGATVPEIASRLGVHHDTLKSWIPRHPGLKESIRRGRERHQSRTQQDFRSYVYGQLPEHLQDLWDRINICENASSSPDRLRAILADQGTRTRQHLFLYALVHHGFSATRACRSVHVSKREFDLWKEDPDFLELINELEWHKGNFYESSLIDRVAEGDVASTIFANKTFNRDRGYGETLKVHQQTTHGGKVEHQHDHQHHHHIDDGSPPWEVLFDHLPAHIKDEIICVYTQLKGVRTSPVRHIPEPSQIIDITPQAPA